MFVANMGILLAGRGYKTVLLDLDMGLRNLDLYMGLENNIVYNIMDVLSGICRVSKAYHALPACLLKILPLFPTAKNFLHNKD